MSEISARSINSTRIRRAILDGARKVFLNTGYTASIDKVAAEAGVARTTIFNTFGSKDNLFSAVLSEALIHEVDVRTLDENGSLEDVLHKFAKQYVEVALSKEAILLGRLVNAEYQRFPEVIAHLSETFMTQMIPPLSRYFKQAMQSGRIVTLDPDMAAERFLASILGNERIRLGLGGTPKTPARRQKYTEEAVRGFIQGICINP
jgi:TetR/AcrR family transcriptional repressor of mexJK operon